MSHPTDVISSSSKVKWYVLIWFKYSIPLTCLKLIKCWSKLSNHPFYFKVIIRWFRYSRPDRGKTFISICKYITEFKVLYIYSQSSQDISISAFWKGVNINGFEALMSIWWKCILIFIWPGGILGTSSEIGWAEVNYPPVLSPQSNLTVQYKPWPRILRYQIQIKTTKWATLKMQWKN